MIKYYTSSHSLQQKLKAKVENLPEIRNWYDTDKMRSNLAIIKDAYTVLAQSSNNRSFLETDFYYIVASKFPRDAVRDLMQKYGSKLTVSQYLTNITMYIEQNEQVMPFGLKNAPAIFQRSVYAILKQKGLNKFSHNYIDDIIVFSKTFDEHVVHLKSVFQAMKESNIKLKTSKLYNQNYYYFYVCVLLN